MPVYQMDMPLPRQIEFIPAGFFGGSAAVDRCHLRDLHATTLHLMIVEARGIRGILA